MTDLPPRARVFCLSMQRTGTTSVGNFFHDVGYRRAGWPADRDNGWSDAWLRGDFEGIFSSPDFIGSNAFEDSPWWLPEFYKVIFHRFPGSLFVLMERDPDDWFRSMLSHSGGNVLGGNRSHAKCYRRELEFADLVARDLVDDRDDRSGRMMTMVGHDQHYKDCYRLHNAGVKAFFATYSPSVLHVGRLEDPQKWCKLADFLGVELPPGYDSHANASARGA